MTSEQVHDNAKMELSEKERGPSRVFTQYLSAFIATLSALAVGTHLAWCSSAIPILMASTSPILISITQASFIAALLPIGAAIGAIPAGVLATLIGPKRILQVLALPLLISWYFIGFSVAAWSICVGRFIAGLGTGAICVAAPMYVAEFSENRIRGTLGTFFQLQVTIGLLLGFVLGGLMDNFKLLALVLSVVPIIFLMTFSLIPESPIFLCSKGRIDEARKSLFFFRGSHYNVEDEISNIRKNITDAKIYRKGFFQLITNKTTVKATLISLALMFFQQMSGINAVLFYATSIFHSAGSTLSANLCTIIIGLVQVLATFASSLLIDKLGRKILLITSALIMAASVGLLGLYFYLKNETNVDVSDYAIVPLISLAIFIVAFSLGFGPIPWMMMAELFSPEVKGIASSASAAFNWVIAFKVTYLFQILSESVGSHSIFGFFSVISIIAALFSHLFVPETKGKSLEEIQEMLMGKPSAQKKAEPAVSLSQLKLYEYNA